MPNLYGAFFLNTLPDSGKGFDQISQCMNAEDNVMCDISTQQEVILESPWIGNCDWIDFIQSAVPKLTADYRINFVSLGATVKSTQSVSVTAVPCIVFARFVKPQFAGPIRGGLGFTGRKVTFQMDTLPIVEADLRPAPHMTNAVTGAIGAVITGVAGTIANNVYNGVYGSPPDNSNSFQPLVREGPSLAEMGKWVKATADSPTVTPSGSDQRDDVRMNPFGSPLPKGLPHLDQHMYGGNHARTKIADWIKVPFYRAVQRLPNDVNEIAGGFVCDPTRHGRSGFVAQAYKKFRGSTNYHYAVVMPPLVSAKYLIIVSYRPVVPTIETLVVGDEITQEINCRGTTTGTITVPYLNQKTYMSTYHSTSRNDTERATPTLYFICLIPPSYQGDVEPFINMYLWMSPGKDFELVGRRDINPTPTDSEKTIKVQFQMKITDFSGVSESVFDSRVSAVKGMDYFEDILFRYSRVKSLYPKMSWPITSIGDPSTMFDWVGSICKFWSGTYQIKAVVPSDADFEQFIGLFLSDGQDMLVNPDSTPPFERTNDGFSIINNEQTRVFEVCVPFQCDNSMAVVSPATNDSSVYYDGYYGNYPDRPYRLKSFAESDVASTVLQTYMSCREDFVFILFFPPPPESTWPYNRDAPPNMIGSADSLSTQSTSESISFSELTQSV